MVLRICRALVGPDVADDAWSETFLSALRAYPALPPESNMAAWLATIAHRKASIRSAPASDGPSPPTRCPSRPRQNDQHIRPDLWAALAALPPKQRQSVTYHHLVGLSYNEIAVILGGTPTAARRAAADGIHALRANLPTHPES
jgi:RNA polymerase sigma factor (sigma-70 family)